MEWSIVPGCPSLLCSFNRDNIDGTNSSKMCVLCFCMYSLCVGIGFVDGLEKEFIGAEFWNVHLLMTEFDCPEVTLCGWQVVKIQSVTNQQSALDLCMSVDHAVWCASLHVCGSCNPTCLCVSVDHAIQHVFVYLWIMQSSMSLYICGSCNLMFVLLCISVDNAVSRASLHLCGTCNLMCIFASLWTMQLHVCLHLCGPCNLMGVFASLWTMQTHGRLCISVDHAISWASLHLCGPCSLI